LGFEDGYYSREMKRFKAASVYILILIRMLDKDRLMLEKELTAVFLIKQDE